MPCVCVQHLCVSIQRCNYCDACLRTQKFTLVEIQLTVGSYLFIFFPQLPHFTGIFHVVNGCIDWRSALFVLRSVCHLRRKQERESRRFDNEGDVNNGSSLSAVLCGMFAVAWKCFLCSRQKVSVWNPKFYHFITMSLFLISPTPYFLLLWASQVCLLFSSSALALF